MCLLKTVLSVSEHAPCSRPPCDLVTAAAMDTETAGGGMVRLRWRGGRSCHAQLVADTVASYHAHHQGDLALVVQVSQQEEEEERMICVLQF